jgi:hypothetical protein
VHRIIQLIQLDTPASLSRRFFALVSPQPSATAPVIILLKRSGEVSLPDRERGFILDHHGGYMGSVSIRDWRK